MIEYAPRALRQVDALLAHCQELHRESATQALLTALAEAERRIENSPSVGLRAPRPYPQLARPGVAWVKAGRYWIAYQAERMPVIVGVNFETANIPLRL